MNNFMPIGDINADLKYLQCLQFILSKDKDKKPYQASLPSLKPIGHINVKWNFKPKATFNKIIQFSIQTGQFWRIFLNTKIDIRKVQSAVDSKNLNDKQVRRKYMNLPRRDHFSMWTSESI